MYNEETTKLESEKTETEKNKKKEDKPKKESDKKENLEQIVSSENLVSLFLDKDRKKEFVKYKDLYKALKISGKTAEEKQAVADEILEVSNELLNEDKMQELYKMGLIPLDTYIDFVGISAVS